jgi:uncharacterized protein YjbJ (UPF0337 family)
MGSIISVQWPVPSSKRTRQAPPAMLVAAGALHQFRGRIAVIRGSLFHNDILRAKGHRQQLVGMLQRFWKQDRRSIELWVDALLRKNITPPSVTRPAWQRRPASRILQQET